MRNTLVKDNKKRQKRAHRVRKTLRGTEAKPRLSVHKTNKYIQVQLIDDEKGITLGQTSSYSKEFREAEVSTKNKATARKLGETIGQIAKDKNIKEVVFDRGPFKYHGILAELADGARSSGLQF